MFKLVICSQVLRVQYLEVDQNIRRRLLRSWCTFSAHTKEVPYLASDVDMVM